MPGTEDLIRGLYEAHPDGFVAGRAAAVAGAKKSGDKEAAKRLAALRKPTVAAWLVNLLALRRPELIDELVELATALRQAQRGLHGDQLRELSMQRRQVVSALVNAARQLATEEDPALRSAKLPMAEVETTLTAALAEPEIAGQVRTGRLVRAATYAGFGEVPRPRLRLITAEDEQSTADEPATEAEAEPSGEQQRSDARRRLAAEQARAERRRELKRELTAARSADQKATSTLERAEAAERDAAHAVDEIEEQLAELERRRAEAQAEVSRRKLARRSAERDASVARRRVGDVEAAIEDLDADEP